MRTFFGKSISILVFISVIFCVHVRVLAYEGAQNKISEQLLNMDGHMPYLFVEKGAFRPDAELTRGDAARMFYALLKDQSHGKEVFTDLSEDCFVEANALGTIGIFTGYGDGEFRPYNPVSRAEFVAILRKFFEFEAYAGSSREFADVPDGHWALEPILFAVSKDWLSGLPDNTFAPDRNITRAEAAVIMNKVLSRTPDKATVDSADDIYTYLDVPAEHWAFYEIMEATVAHDYERNNNIETWTRWLVEPTGLSEGLHLYGGNLFYINDGGYPIRSANAAGRDFDANGRHTTGNKELDRYITLIVGSLVNDGMSAEEGRRAIYNYVENNYDYRMRDLAPVGSTGWEYDYALNMFKDGVGNCFSYASAYGVLVDRVGFEVNYVSGLVGRDKRPHAWTELIIDGKVFIDDPNLDRSSGHSFYNQTYDTASVTYTK